VTSLILVATTALLEPLLLLFSIYLLLIGHNEPGGGFSGGLVASGVFTLHLFAYDAASARRMLLFAPQTLIGAGLAVALLAGAGSAFASQVFLTGLWSEIHLPGIGVVPLGTPLLFDVGVYVTVVGVTTLLVLSLAEEER
jgi:multicomponent Na+:H+ antiporter subunit B